MPVETLNCPMCGAPASSDSARCEHCGARLATVACPACFGLMFAGAQFCSHCGARAAREVENETVKESCPRCRVDMESVLVGNTQLRECSRCEGIWVDKTSLEQICANQEKQAAVMDMGAPLPSDAPKNWEPKVCYVPCPVCHELMNRVNFANCSHVVVDVCQKHGTWFDKDELRQIVDFIKSGGIEKARVIESEELERSREQLKSSQFTAPMDFGNGGPGLHYRAWEFGISAVADVILALLRR